MRVVSVVGGYDAEQTAEVYAGMVPAATEAGAIGVSIYDWPTTPSSAWAPLQDYAASGCRDAAWHRAPIALRDDAGGARSPPLRASSVAAYRS